jgi:hypothetical protein
MADLVDSPPGPPLLAYLICIYGVYNAQPLTGLAASDKSLKYWPDAVNFRITWRLNYCN